METKNKIEIDLGKSISSVQPEDVEKAAGAYFKGYFGFLQKSPYGRLFLIAIAVIFLLAFLGMIFGMVNFFIFSSKVKSTFNTFSK